MERNSGNLPWNLESFVDALIIELDKARDTLALKGINRPLTYSVKDLSLEMQVFPQFDGEQVQFITAKAGQDGASKISLQLASITDRQIRESTKDPISEDDIPIEKMPDLDAETKTNLRKVGITSSRDIEKIKKRKVNLEKVTESKVDYERLSQIIEKARRRPPKVKSASMRLVNNTPVLYLTGENLVVNDAYKPQAYINRESVKYLGGNAHALVLSLAQNQVSGSVKKDLSVWLDPFAIIQMTLS